MTHKVKCTIAYDGTHYSGWQIQPNHLTIQEVLEKYLSQILQEKIKVIGSGRTDAGVHALGQIAHFTTSKDFDPKKLTASLNRLLPPDIRIQTLEVTSPSFHARFSAKQKTYFYHLYLNPILPPFKRNYALHVHQTLDINLLKKAAQEFIGRHDFTSFANHAHEGAAANKPIKNLYRLDIIEEEGGLRLEFEGDGFLYKMVRNIVGTLIEIASGKRDLTDIPTIFAAKNRQLSGKAAPPHGLFLIKVDYS